MNLDGKLAVLADAAKYDASCASSGAKGRKATTAHGLGTTEGVGVCHSFTPDGRCVSLLKLLLTNYCVYDCLYCVNRRSSPVARARFRADEVVRLTLDFYRRNYVEGLFLSSGIVRSSDYTMEQLVLVARTLRVAHDFQGYIHLKTIPHASPELVAEAGRWADRLSINVELPTQGDLDALAPEKDHRVIRRAMADVRAGIDAARAGRPAAPNGGAAPTPRGPELVALRRAAARGAARPAAAAAPALFAPAGQSTQLIVGATAASDATILGTATALYQAHRLRRVYYSAFSPIPDAPGALPSVSPPPPPRLEDPRHAARGRRARRRVAGGPAGADARRGRPATARAAGRRGPQRAGQRRVPGVRRSPGRHAVRVRRGHPPVLAAVPPLQHGAVPPDHRHRQRPVRGAGPATARRVRR